MINFDKFLESMPEANLENVVGEIMTLKGLAPDLKIVGQNSVSGDKYFENFISIGTIYKNPSGKFKIIVDAIFYPEHTVESGKHYDDEVRFISYEFNPDTLELTGKRNNVGYDFLKNKCEIIATDSLDYLIAFKAKENMGKVTLSLDENLYEEDDDYYDDYEDNVD